MTVKNLGENKNEGWREQLLVVLPLEERRLFLSNQNIHHGRSVWL